MKVDLSENCMCMYGHKKKVLDSQVPPRLPKRLCIYHFFCVKKKKKNDLHLKKMFVSLKHINR